MSWLSVLTIYMGEGSGRNWEGERKSNFSIGDFDLYVMNMILFFRLTFLPVLKIDSSYLFWLQARGCYF